MLKNRIKYTTINGAKYPELQISKNPNADKIPVGRYGQMYLNYLKNKHPERYTELRMSGELMPLADKINEFTQHKYYQVPKELYTNPRYKTTTSNDAKMLYALLLDRMGLSHANNWVEDDGTIFLIFKREDLADMLGICTTTVWRAIKQLKAVGLIEEKRQGLNKPNLIYIGKIDYSIPNEINDNDDNPSKQIGDLKIKCQDIEKLKTNKTDNNKTENYIKTKKKNITEFNSS